MENTLLYLILAFALGGLFIWLLFRFVVKPVSPALLREIDHERARLQEKSRSLKEQLDHTTDQLETNESVLVESRNQLIRQESENKYLLEKLRQQEADLLRLKDQMSDHFDQLAHRALQKNSDRINELQSDRLDLLLNPLKEKLVDFEKKIEDGRKQQSVESQLLKEEVKRLTSINHQMSEEARMLTRALKGDQVQQGNWGELILEKILQSSGLVSGKEYVVQKQFQNEQGARFRPDVVIHLPDDKHLIIDSKVSLKAYEAFSRASEVVEKQKHLDQHLLSIRQHIKGLSEKHYQKLPQLQSPDFVLMFMPIEGAFSLAIGEHEQGLFDFAWERKVVLVSPTTLLATLKTVSSIWKNEKQNRNALLIAEESGKLYDKFYGLAEDLEKVGKAFQTGQNAYDDAIRKLSQGRGNLLSKAQKLKQMGVKAKKDLNQLEIGKNNQEQPE